MKTIPRVQFVVATAAFEADIIGIFLEGSWGEKITHLYPELRTIQEMSDGKKQKTQLKKSVTAFLKTNANEFQRTKKNFQKDWDRIEKKILPTLVQIIGTDFPATRKRIEAIISQNPVCPRFLPSWSFSVYLRCEDQANVRRIVTHEVTHFLHFKKWREMHPEADSQTFEAPHREWLLSELAAVAVLNDPRIRTVVGMREKPYKEHRKIKIDGRCAPVVINQLYKQSIKNGRGYEWFLEEGMKLVKKAI